MEYRKLATKYYFYDQLPDDLKHDAMVTMEGATDGEEEQYSMEDVMWYYTTVPVDVSIFDDIPDPEEHFESCGYDMPALIEDIKKNGVRTPVVIGPYGFEGHHRMWAAYMVGLEEIPALMYKYDTNY